MNKTNLSLEVSLSNNPKVMRLFDTSFYYNDQVVENYIIEILPVNKTKWIPFYVQKNFSLALNSSSLQYRKASCAEDLMSLPDGIYEIKQSIKPNIETLNHFYHFRITSLLNDILQQKNKIITEECKYSQKEFESKRNQLRDIEEYALGAKWKVEECGDKKKGKELYDFAHNAIKKYKNECQC